MLNYYFTRLNDQRPVLKAFHDSDHRLRAVTGWDLSLSNIYIRRCGAQLFGRREGMPNQRMQPWQVSRWTDSRCFFTDGSNVVTVDFVYFTQCHPYTHTGTVPHITRVSAGKPLDAKQLAKALRLRAVGDEYAMDLEVDLGEPVDFNWITDYTPGKLLYLRCVALNTEETPGPDTQFDAQFSF